MEKSDIDKEINEFVESLEKDLFFEDFSTDLYHYTSPRGLLGIAESHSLRFSYYRSLNDVSEGIFIKKLVESCLSDNEFSKRVKFALGLTTICKEYFEAEKENRELYPRRKNQNEYFICSFSTDEDSLALWNYYTKTESGIGYNIGLNPTDLRINLEQFAATNTALPFTVSFYRVLYYEYEQLDIISKLIEGFEERWNKESDTILKQCYIDRLLDTIDMWSFYFKHKGFEAEKEVRIVLAVGSDNYEQSIEDVNSPIKIRESNGLFIPYMDIKCLDDYNINRIICSPSVDKKYAELNLFNLAKRYNLHCGFDTSKIPFRK